MAHGATRSQRRLEKKQALGLLALGLVIALVSFGLGVLVGRGGANTVAEQEDVASERIAIAVPEEGAPLADGATTTAPEEQLTFYDSLPEGQQPLGSGVNLPPQPERSEVILTSVAESRPKPVEVSASRNGSAGNPPQNAKAETRPKPAEVSAPAPGKAPDVAVAKAAVPSTAVAGGYVVQVVSVKKKDGADGLRKRLAAKGYGVFVEQADLGVRGVWYRVYAGPYHSRAEADRVVAALRANRLADSPLVKRR